MQIDLHCHLLPQIDDGPATPEESLALLKLFVEDDIQQIVVTPHITPNHFDNNKTKIAAVFDTFQQLARQQGFHQIIQFAAEVRAGFELIPLIERQQVPFLGQLEGYDIMLLEMPHHHIPFGTDKLIQWLLDRKIRPMIAHPERNGDIIKKLDNIQLFIESNCLIQLTAASVAGAFKADITKRTQQILEKGWADILATDAHNCKHRPPLLTLGRKAAAQIVGEQEAWALVSDTPAAIIKKSLNL